MPIDYFRSARRCLVGLFVSLLPLSGCFPSSDELQQATPRFSTTESSLLYFKNVRLAFYEQRDQPNATIVIYEPSKPTHVADQPGWHWFMAHNWTQDRAYLFQKSTDPLGADPCSRTVWFKPSQEPVGRPVSAVKCPGIYPEDNFMFAVDAYRQIDAGLVGYIELKSGKRVAIFPSDEAQRRFVRLVRDFLELVDLL